MHPARRNLETPALRLHPGSTGREADRGSQAPHLGPSPECASWQVRPLGGPVSQPFEGPVRVQTGIRTYRIVHAEGTRVFRI
jgi:hypothetical protein